jgi:transcriptional regulator of heat shock response
MKDTTLIFRNISLGNSQFAVGVIGPRGMNYSKVIDMINRLANGIDRLLSDENN